jgi:ABC-type nitrate/sulfonate/bicarbonate transport system permease component
LGILAFLAAWEIAALLLGDQILPTPGAVAADFGLRLTQRKFFGHLWASFHRAAIGFALGLFIAIPLGWLMGSAKKFDDYLAPLLF